MPGPSTAEPGSADDGDWFDTPAESAPAPVAGDDWFDGAEGAHEPPAATDDFALFGLVDSADDAVRPAAPTPVSLDALGQGLDELFGLPMVGAADQTASQWLEALGTEMVGRVTPGPLDLPIPAALDVPAPDPAPGVPAPLLSFDRFFGATPPGVRRQETPSAGGTSIPSAGLGTTFGATPLVTPPTPFAPVPPPPEPPTLPDAAAPGTPPTPPAGESGGEAGRPKSEFHRWLEGLS